MTNNGDYTPFSSLALVDFSAAQDYLARLESRPNTFFSSQTYDDTKEERPKLARIRHFKGTQLPEWLLPELKQLNENSGGVFVTINETDGRGRKAENIIRVRALYIDLDGPSLQPVMDWELPPHMVVQSSLGRFHCYWVVEGMPLEDFRPAQRALIERFNADPGVNDLPHVMRVPGFYHRKCRLRDDGSCEEPFLIRIHYINKDLPPYRADQFEKKAELVRAPSNSDDNKLDPLLAQAVVEYIPNNNLDWSDWNLVGMAIWRETGGSDAGFKVFDEFSQRCPGKYRARTTRNRWRHYFNSPPDQIGIKKLIWFANKLDPDWRQKMDQDVMESLDRAVQEAHGKSVYELNWLATPEEQRAGAPVIKRPAPLVDEPQILAARMASQCEPQATTAEQTTTTAPVEPEGETITEQKTTTAPAEPQPQTQQQGGSTAGQTTTAVPPPRTTTPTSQYYELVCAADVVPRAKTYLWHGHLLRGALELLTGMSDLGKSQNQIRMVASITTGQKWPDGTPATVRGNVIMVTAEDTLDQDMVPRLLAVGADLHRVFFLKKIKRDKLKRMFLLSEDLEILRLMIKDIGDVLAVLADPITAFMGKVDSHRATDVRGQLGPLADMSEETQTAFSAVTHPSKNAGPRALNHFIGSQAFIAAARIGHLCIEELDDEKEPTGRVLFTNPRNSGGKMPTLAYRKVVVPVGHDPVTGAVITASHVIFEDKPVGISADQALAAAAAPGREGSPATDFLTMILNNGPLAAAEVFSQARDAGFSRDQLKRAKEKLKVEVTKLSFNEGWVWALPPM